MKKKHDSKFKARVALEAIKEGKKIVEIASEYGIHPNLVGQWKKKMLESLPEIFERGEDKKVKETEKERDELYRQIGIQKIENEWLKKSWIRSSGKQRYDRAGT
jgi:transposase